MSTIIESSFKNFLQTSAYSFVQDMSTSTCIKIYYQEKSYVVFYKWQDNDHLCLYTLKHKFDSSFRDRYVIYPQVVCMQRKSNFYYFSWEFERIKTNKAYIASTSANFELLQFQFSASWDMRLRLSK